MNKIISKEKLAEGIYRFSIENKEIAKAQEPGQFVILRVNERGERIPLTIVDGDAKIGTIDIIFQVVGKSTRLLSELSEGDSILDIAGPLGNPTHIEKHGRCLMIGGGVGTAVLFPVLKAFKKAGNEITSIIGARNKSLLILLNKIKKISDKLIIVTDDGSMGNKGFVTDALSELLSKGEVFNFVFAVGPVIMMQKVTQITKEHNIKTVVSLNPIMIDGTGMCGGCRCLVEGKVKFACIHGPEFDAHKVNFELLERRLNMFKDKEKEALEDYEQKRR